MTESESYSTTPSSQKKKVSAEFVNNVKKYIEIDNALNDFKERSKKLNKFKREKEEFILTYLQNIEEERIDIVDGHLKKIISKRQAPFKKETIQETLRQITGDAIKAQEITDQLVKARPIIEKISLKRIKNKQ